MIQPARLPAPDTTIPMDPEHSQRPNEAPTPQEVAAAAPTAAPPQAKPSWMDRLPENPLQAILGAAIVLLLGFALTLTNDRITQTNDRITRLEDKVDAGFAKIDERFAVQDAKFDEINLKLTALIAALNATDRPPTDAAPATPGESSAPA